MRKTARQRKRGTLLLMVVGLLATLFLIVSAYITVAQFDSLAMRSAGQRDAVDQILKSIDQMVLANVMQSWVDGEGSVLAGGRRDPSSTTSAAVVNTYSPEDRLGSRATRWLAGPEPVRDRALDIYLPGGMLVGAPTEMRVYRQTVSIMDGSYLEATDLNQSNQLPLVGSSGQATLDWFSTQAQIGLMLEDPSDQDAVFDLAYDNDVRRNVLRPFMDASGDGIADSAFAGTAALTEIANAVGGVAVRAPGGALATGGSTTGFNPSAVGDPDSDLMAAMFRRFENQARYDVAVKVISHGGLVALASPGNHTPAGGQTVWNREFTTEMFNWVRKRQYDDYSSSWGDDRLGYHASTWQDPNRWFNELHASAGAVEPYLRYRGGLVANQAETGAATGLPTVLQELREAFPFTMDLTQQVVGVPSRTDPTQRFNLATLYDPFVTSLQSDWFLWRAGATMDPNEYLYQTSYNPRAYYVRRQLLTTISNSDELAREIDPQSPNPALPQTNIGLYPGQLKFYLGDIARAFNVNGQYMSQVLPDGSTGNIIVRRLADYFYEMLADTQGWKNLSDETEVLTRREQACMLAVNTVAFAAPRSNTGFIDAVWLTDGLTSVKYVGYAPQPFITQVIAYGEEGDTSSKKIGVAVELFYPHDPGPGWNPLTADKFDENDPFALDLSQFYISVTERHATGLPGAGEEPTSTALRLSEAVGAQPMTRLVGRNFLALTLDNGWTESPLRGFAGVDGHLNTLAPVGTTPHGGRDVIEVKLWRQDSQNGLHLIDKLVVGDLGEARIPSRPGGFGGGGFGEEEDDEDFKWLVDYYRDTGLEPVFGGDWNDDGFVDTPARWRMVMNTRGAHAEDNDGGFTVSVSTRMEKIGQPGPVPSTSADEHFAPTVPLYTMNAGDTNANNPAPWSLTARPLPRGFFTVQPIHGSYRPKSFPTVGFMLFVPRYAHTGSKPMSETLAEQWAKWGGEVDLGDDSSYYTYETSSEDPSGGTGGFGSAGRPTVRVNRGLYPADFGHMPVFDNNQDVRNNSYFDLDPGTGTRPAIPWGQLVFDYFTTLDPSADYDGDLLPDVDPWRVPGRININTAPWYVIAGLPLVHPMYLNDGSSSPASPAFWSAKSGVLVGAVPFLMQGAHDTLHRFEQPVTVPGVLEESEYSFLWYDQENGWYRLGPELALAIVSYRDRLRYVTDNTAALVGGPLWLAEYRNANTNDLGGTMEALVLAGSRYRNERTGDLTILSGYPYGPIRRGSGSYPTGPAKYERGFLTLGELANVKGFDSSVYHPDYPGEAPRMLYNTLGAGTDDRDRPDFFKAVSLMALLDTHFLVTRSNTFTVYTTLTDRDPERPHGSIRTQYTVDRSNLLPRLVMQDTDGDGFAEKPRMDGEAPVIIQNTGQPEILSRRQVGYYDTRFDQ
jgi:hypothetical protein